MFNANITGWGEAVPPAILGNDDLSTFLDTSDEWITTRTGMKERRVSHVSGVEMATTAAQRALACAGLDPADLELIVYGSCGNEEQVPNCASRRASLTRCDARGRDGREHRLHPLYGLASATGMIQSGIVRNAVVSGVELITRYMDWSDRSTAVLFGDGAAAVAVQATR